MSKYLSAFLSALLFVAASSTLGCGPAKTAGNAVIDCLAADRAKIDTIITDLATKTKPDGTRDWSAIEVDAIGAGVVIGGCALAEFIQTYLTPSPGVKAPMDGAEARQTLEHFRSTQAGNASFKTKFGAL